VVVELLPEIHRLKIPFLDPWAAADPITEHGFSPDYVFRLSLRDTWAIESMMRHAAGRGLRKVALLLPNSEWGRSNLRAAQRQVARTPGQHVVAYPVFNTPPNISLINIKLNQSTSPSVTTRGFFGG
jgi:branched-chain amino acid transport system substrate-binding protein